MSRATTVLTRSLGVLIVTAALAGCAPTPEPTPTPTGFASEEEAFAAAEETYRAYVDALNDVDLSDPETFEPVYALTTGEANAGARETFSEYHANGWQVNGTTIATVIVELPKGEAFATKLDLAICLDVSDVDVVDPTGDSVVGSDRPPVQAMTVSMTRGGATWRISEITGREGPPECT
ncbi:hypothetical protein GCM10009816_20030 [Microbacterium aquimaris]|uniref:Lipoprotein n=2 Tax=Microbacterium aquimaris TaxID=459816 RepID=A0ABU5N8Y9_9MICO|nr:hypothetical protein [Microbacterium aquimaris]MDZ8162554.1 hypothetical protein [Microbacterium aquimaris]